MYIQIEINERQNVFSRLNISRGSEKFPSFIILNICIKRRMFDQMTSVQKQPFPVSKQVNK